MSREKDMKVAIILNDLHVPYHDQRAIDVMLHYVKDKNPDDIILAGDLYDCYALSRFDKDPKRIDSLQDEIDEGLKIWKSLKKASPKSRLTLIEGNHEHRLQKYLMKNPGMYSLNALKPENLFCLKDLNINFKTSEETFFLNANLVITHGAIDDGCKLSQHSGYSAKNTLDKWGNTSGVMGHSHRMGVSNKTIAHKQMVQWVENGCLCKLNPDYVKNPNWQQGFSVIYYTKNRFHIVPILIANYEFIADGKRYR